ncbi:MAG: hypothetical protein ACR2LX_02290 [Jatrophihabitans sp.]
MSDAGAQPALEHARAVADAVLYEGYLLYPYRATSSKNQSRWQFGVLGPPGAAEGGYGEDAAMSAQLLLRTDGPDTTVAIRPRFLQLQARVPQQRTENGNFIDVDELSVGTQSWLRFDEAVEQEPAPTSWRVEQLLDGEQHVLDVPGGEHIEDVGDGARLVRSRRPLQALVRAAAVPAGDGLIRLSVSVENTAAGVAGDPASAVAHSLIGAHVLVSVTGGEFVSMTDPAPDTTAAAAACSQHRCWPVLAGPDGDRSLMLVSPIILYDHPEIAEQSAGSLFDSTEIDEILTLRVMTMTDEEKATARATDAKAAEIIDRCDAMSPDAMQALHGVLRNPHAGEVAPDDPFLPGPPDAFGNDLTSTLGFGDDVPWWDPAVDGSVDPSTDSVVINGVRVAAGSIVRLNPWRRSDAQDIFFAGQTGRVTAIHTDVDGQTHVAVVLVDDPAADMHEWYGRFLHFAPDEIEPVSASPPTSEPQGREETRSWNQ